MDMMTKDATGTLAERRRLPMEVMALLPREREIATIVHTLRAATAQQVTDRVSSTVSNAAVRSMLNRLVAKGILKRVLSRNAYIYLPALTFKDSGARALARFAEDYFDGSIQQAATVMKFLLNANE